jgi:hypothetical protein
MSIYDENRRAYGNREQGDRIFSGRGATWFAGRHAEFGVSDRGVPVVSHKFHTFNFPLIKSHGPATEEFEQFFGTAWNGCRAVEAS